MAGTLFKPVAVVGPFYKSDPGGLLYYGTDEWSRFYDEQIAGPGWIAQLDALFSKPNEWNFDEFKEWAPDEKFDEVFNNVFKKDIDVLPSLESIFEFSALLFKNVFKI